MLKEASTVIAHNETLKKNKLVQNVWRANINSKLKESVPHEPLRMGLQAIAWAVMATILLVVIILITIRKRCETESTLLSVTNVQEKEKDEGYTCEAISSVPQKFDGQSYYETAFFWGFAVPSAWGTFNGTSWDQYCEDLMTLATTEAVVQDASSPEWTHEYDTPDGTLECIYETSMVEGLDTLPNAPGSEPFGCSFGFNDGSNLCTLDGETVVDAAEIPGTWSQSKSYSPDDPFCPDFIMWHANTVRNSPFDDDANVPLLCEVWGQDVGIISRAVESCTKDICMGWWSILAQAFSLALGAEVAVVLLIVISYKTSEFLEEKKKREQGGGDEEKDNEDEEKEAEDAEKELKSLAKEAGEALYGIGNTIKEAVV